MQLWNHLLDGITNQLEIIDCLNIKKASLTIVSEAFVLNIFLILMLNMF